MGKALAGVWRPIGVVAGIGLILIVILPFIVAPRAAGRDVRTLTIDVNFDTQRVIGASDAGPGRGDVWSGGGTVFAGDLEADDAIGAFYFMGFVTANRWDESAANHLFEVGRFELWGQGSLDVMGTANFDAPSYLSIVGGTGSFATARGQCTEEMVASRRGRFTCEIQ